MLHLMLNLPSISSSSRNPTQTKNNQISHNSGKYIMSTPLSCSSTLVSYKHKSPETVEIKMTTNNKKTHHKISLKISLFSSLTNRNSINGILHFISTSRSSTHSKKTNSSKPISGGPAPNPPNAHQNPNTMNHTRNPNAPVITLLKMNRT